MSMEKANRRMSLTELKQFIKAHNLNKIYKPDLLLTQSKGNLIKGLIKHGYWEEPRKPEIRRFKIINHNFHELTIYKKRSEGTLLTRFFYTEPYGATIFKEYETIQYIYIIPQLEVNEPTTSESVFLIEESVLVSNKYARKIDLHSLYKEWVEEIQSIKAKLEHTTDEREIIKIQSEISKKNVATYNIKPYDYSPPKSELEKWKEVGLKSNYLLQELIKLGGMKYPNLEPILDMVQDIHLPPHTDNDKEIAGIPSGLTNITQTTSINE